MTKKTAIPRLASRSPHSPIQTAAEDDFGFLDTANFIASSIMNREDNEGWIVGIDGVWGEGKSSLINLVEIELLSDRANWRNPTVIKFEPWLSGDTQELVANFFRLLADAFNDLNQAQHSITSWRRWEIIWLKARIRGTLSTLASQVSGAGFLAALASLNFPLAVLASIVQLFSGKPSLEAKRNLAQKLISKMSKDRKELHVVYIIDDLDRLEPDEALEIIRLVKAAANFSNITYLISYDRSVLAHAIMASADVEDGNAYLEKIIQFGVKVPAPGPFRIRRFLRRKLESAFESEANWKSARAGVVLDTWAGRLLKTPRDVIRIFESVRLKWAKLHYFKADLLDLIWVEMLKEKASKDGQDLYSWVISYVSSLEAIAIGGQVSQRHQTQSDLAALLEKVGWKPPTQGENIELDFHHLDLLLAGVSKGYLSSSGDEMGDERLWIFQIEDKTFEEFRTGRRFTSPWHWGLYLGFRQSDNALPDAVWERLRTLAHEGNEDLTNAVRTVMEVSEFNLDRDTIGDQLLELVINDVEQSTPDVCRFWWKSIMDAGDEIYNRSASSGFGFKRLAGFQVEKLTQSVLSKMSTTDRHDLLTRVYKDAKSLWALCEVYRDQYFEHSDEHPDRDSPFLSEAEFELIQEILLERLLVVPTAELAKTPDTWSIAFSILNAAGGDRARIWFERITAEEDSFVAVLQSLQTIQSSEQKAPGIPEGYLKHFADASLIKKRLKSIADANSALAKEADGLLKNWWNGSR